LKLGIEAGQKGEAREALENLLVAQSRYRQKGDRHGEAVALSYLGPVYEYIGEKAKAVGCYEQALALLRALGDKPGEASMLMTLGKAFSGLGDPAKALDCYQQSLAIQRGLKSQAGEVAALSSIGKVYRDLGNQAKAFQFEEQALRREWGNPPLPPWTDKASLSFLVVSGNATSQSFGFSNDYTRNWSDASALTIGLAAVRVATRLTTYSATGSSPTSFTLSSTQTDQVTTADYTANARFAQNLTEEILWFAAGGWERNLPAGLDDRTVGSAGLGYWWTRTPRSKFRTDLGLGYTKAVPVVEAPGFQVSYATGNMVVSYERKLGAASVFASNLNGADSLTEGRNFLAVWRNDLSTSLSRRLTLKVGYVMTYNNRPASQAVPIFLTGSAPPVTLGNTLVELKKLDTILSASLVVSF
jgi:tetratricopeptide (TPR) repeat protein